MNDSRRSLNFHTDLCLCGSGKLLKDCCLTKRYGTQPKKTKTGYSHPKCYARIFLDCSIQLSREHYISRGLLNLFGERNFYVEGFPWAPYGEKRFVSAESLTGRMLCTRHNEILSELDNLAKIFFEFFIKDWNGKEIDICLINGKEIERWFLKTLSGLVASGNATLNEKRLIQWTPPIEWLNILFCDNHLDDGAGLYYIYGNYKYEIKSINAHSVFKTTTGQPVALALAVSGIAFLFSMEEPPDLEKPTSTGAVLKYRPKILQLSMKGQTREAHFGWPDGPFIGVNLSDL